MEHNLKELQKIFDLNFKYTFLIGAGISINPPSNVPSSGKMIENLIEKVVPIEEIKFFKSIKKIKFEHVIEGIKKYIDKDLNFFDFFVENNVPNSIHFVLAKLLITDNQKFDLITTNFDCLIEYSLIQLLSKKKRENIDPIILKDDFLKYNNLNERNSLNNFPIFKIHGSVRNIIKKIDTKDSLIATFSSLGRNRPAGKTFSLEDYKFDVFKKLLEDRILIVLGYSGSDLLDIIPSLTRNIGMKKIIWIQHVKDENSLIINEIQKINSNFSINLDDKVSTQSLLRDMSNRNKCKSYLIKTNTQKFVKTFLVNRFLKEIDVESIFPVQEKPICPIIFKNYIENLYESLSILKKYEFAYHLSYKLSLIDDSLRINENALNVSIQMDQPKVYLKILLDRTEFLSNYDRINEAKFILEKFLDDINSKKYSINPELEKFLKLMVFRQLSILYRSIGDFNNQMNYLSEAINLVDGMTDFSELRFTLMNDLALAFMKASNIDSGLRIEYLESALKILKDLIIIAGEKGDLINKAGAFGNIGSIYYQKEEYIEAIRYFKKGLAINKIIGNQRGIAIRLFDIGENYRLLNESKKALKYLDQSKKIYGELGLNDSKDSYFTFLSLGYSYMDLYKFNLARKNFEIVKKISEKYNFRRNEPLRALIELKKLEKKIKKKNIILVLKIIKNNNLVQIVIKYQSICIIKDN